MTVQHLSGFHGDIVSGQQSTNLIATIGGPAVLTRLSVNGLVSLKVGAFSLVTGSVLNWDLVAGIQYGAEGYTVAPIIDGSRGASQWVTFNECLPVVSASVDLAGTSPINYVDGTTIALNQVWTGMMPIPLGYDFYVVVGCDKSQTYAPSFRGFYNWDVEWATYP